MDAPAPSSPLRGRYLVRQPLANASLALLDHFLALVQPSRRSAAIVPSPQRILLANGAHLGDVVIATAVLPVLKRAFPQVRIGFLIGSWARAVLEHHPLVDCVHVIDHWKLNRASWPVSQRFQHYFQSRRRALRAIRAGRYDVAIDLYPYFPNSIPLLWQAGIPTRIGYTSGGFSPLLTHALDWVNKACHIAEYHADLLRFLPLPEDGLAHLQPALLPSPAPTDVALARLPKDFLVFHLGTGSTCKEWPVKHWRTLAETVSQAGHVLAFTGNGSAENRNILEVMDGLPRCVNLCGLLPWSGFVDALRRARLLVSVDSVAGHVAAAVGTPCVIVASGINNPAHWRPRGAPCRVLTHPVVCAPCYRSQGCDTMDCVRGVTVSQIAAALHELLARPARLAS